MKPSEPTNALARLRTAIPLMLTAGLMLAPAVVHAQSSFTWDGGDGSSVLWSTAGNWNPDGAPANTFNANFTFGGTFHPGTAGVPLNNDLTTGTITNLTFSVGAAPFYLGGNTFTNRGHITNSSGVAQNLSLGMVLGVNTPFGTNTHFIDVGTGSITNNGSIIAPSATASQAKIGTGTLVLNSPLTNSLANGTPGGGTGYWVPGFGADEGTIIFDGGPTSVYNITGEGAFGRNAPTGNKNVTAILQSGKLAGTTWIGIGRGNGTGDVLAELILNGSSVFNPVNWSGCYNSGDPAKRPRGSVTQNGTSLFWVTGTDNSAESTGAYLTHTVNDSATRQTGTTVQGQTTTANVGMAGRYVLKQTSPTAKVTSGRMVFGTAAGGAGAFYNRGIFILYSPADVNHFAIGNASGGATPANNSFAYYLNDTLTPVGLNEIGIGGSGGGNGVLEVRQGTVTVTNWVTVCRSGGATASSAQTAMLMIRNGTLNAPNVEQFRYLWSGSGITEFGIVDVGAGGKIGSLNGPNSAIDLAQSANTLSTSLLTLGGGAVVEVGRIFAAQAAPLNLVNFNGCTLAPTKNISGFIGNNLDGVYVHAGGVIFDTKGFDITVNPQLQAPLDQGIASIPVATPGGGYIGRPIVRITGGGGQGATAIAEWNEAAGTVTGITVTCPGTGYFSTPTVDLVGGGFTNAATLGAATLGSAPGGGLIKTGAGTLTLSGGSTYTGPTVLKGGTLSVVPAVTFPSTPGPLTISNATLSVDLAGGFSTYPAGTMTLGDNATNTLNYGSLFANPFTPGIAVSGNLQSPGANIVINVTGFGMQVGQFPLISYTGTGPSSLANFSLGLLPPGVVATLVNNTSAKTIDLNVSSAGQNLAWYGLLPDGISVSSNWDITLTTNWLAVGTLSPSLRYQEYTAGGSTVGDPVRFDDQVYNDFVNPQVTNVFLATQLRPFTVTVDSTLPYTLGGVGRLSGVGSLVKSNIGTLTIGTSNDYTGGTFLYGGSLIVSNNSGLGAPAGAVTLGGGTLQINGNLTNSRPITVGVDNPLNVAAGVTAQFGGVFSGTSRLLLGDTGTVIVTNNNRLQFHVRQGTLVFDGSARITNTTSYSSVGQTTGDNGSLIVRSNATFEINQDFNVGDVNDARGRVDLQNNAVIRTLNLWLGKNNTCTGLLYQAGGILTNHVTGGADLRLAGNDAAGTATFGGYYLSGGRADLQKNFQIGAYGTGEMIVSGGVLNQWAGYPVVGRFTNGVGFLTVSAGQFNQLNTGTFLIIGENGTGTLNLSGSGVVTLTNNLRLGGAGGNGTLNLNTGGRLITPGIQLMADGVATANFNGGTLQPGVANGTFLQGLTAANVLAGGVVVDTAGKDTTIGQPLLNGGAGGGLTKNGLGTLTLSGASTYTGATLVNTGRVFVTPAFAGSGPVTVADGATFGVLLPTIGTVTIPSLALGSTGASSLDFSLGTNGNPGVAPLNAATLTVNGTVSVHLAGKFSLGTFPLVKYTGAIAGSGSLNPVVVGPQGLVASLSNHVAGSTLYVTVSSLGPGIVWTGTNSAPALTNLWDINSTTNWLVGGSPTTYQELAPPGDAVTFTDSGSGVVVLSNSVSPTSILVTNATRNYTLQGPGRLAGSAGLTKQGAATLKLGLAGNDYVGETLVSAGTLQLGSGTAIPDGSGRAALNISSGATVELDGWSETVNGLTGSGVINNNNTTNAVLTVGNGDASSTWNGTLNNNGAAGISLTKVGAGTLTVGGTNLLNHNGAQAQAASQVNGGSLVLPTGGWFETSVGEFWIGQGATTGSVVVAGGTLAADNNWIAIGRANAAGTGTLTVNSGRVIKAGNGNIVLGSLGGTGNLVVNGGEVLNNAMLWLGEGATANGYLYLNGGLVQASQVRSNNNAGFPLNAIAYLNGGTLQTTADSADYFQCAALVQSNGFTFDDGGFAVTLATSPLVEDPASLGGGLVKKGAGTLYLNTANTYTGLTLVTNGTLAGAGSVMGPVQVASAGNLAPGVAGTNVGTFTLGAKVLTLQGKASFRIKKVGGLPENDNVAGISTVNYGGTLVVTNLNTEPLVVGDQFTLFSASGSTGTFGAIVGSPGAGLAYQFSPASGILSIVTGTASNPTNITYSLNANALTITWPATHLGWILQGQTNSLNVGISNNWSDIPGTSTSTQAVIPVNPANPAVFFRLRSP